MPKPDKPQLRPLAISCTSTDCGNSLHCFRQKKRKGEERRHGGPCRTCGADLVEWGRVESHDISDVQYTFEALRKELIRHEYWHRAFDQRALNHARRKGRQLLKEAVIRRIEKSVGKAGNPRDGRQTPLEGNVIYYAQHALACCCRKCIEYWHGIPAGRDLSSNEVSYLSTLVEKYLDERLPHLKDVPEKVPPIRFKSRGSECVK